MRTLLIGIDGLDPDLVEDFDLPNIESIGDGYRIKTYGNTGPSWTTILTGLTDEKHGIDKLSPGQDRHTWDGIPLWDKVSGYCGIANVPLTYPPADIRGWMVTGMMTPDKSIYTSPPSLYKKLDERGYRIDMWVDSHQNHPNGHYGTLPFEFSQEFKEESLDELRDVLTARGKCFEWLLDEYTPVDVGFLCFTALDRVQHLAFDDMDIIEEFYKLADEQVGRVMEASNDADTFITSDHGFQLLETENSDLTGDHHWQGYAASSDGAEFGDLLDVHDSVVESAERSNVEERLKDLGYL